MILMYLTLTLPKGLITRWQLEPKCYESEQCVFGHGSSLDESFEVRNMCRHNEYIYELCQNSLKDKLL